MTNRKLNAANENNRYGQAPYGQAPYGQAPYGQAPYGQAGYPAIEKLIETEDFEEINAAYEAAYAELMEVSRRKKGLKTQREAGKAMRALELTMDLLRELLAIKYRLQEEFEKKKH